VQVAAPVTEPDIHLLASLHKLEHLTLQLHEDEEISLAQMLAGMTALTCLSVNACSVQAMACVSSCGALQKLRLGCADGLQDELGPGEWDSLGLLTDLTSLELVNAHMYTAAPACVAALSKLNKLQVVAAAEWSADVLSAYTACTQLRKISGPWQAGGCTHGARFSRLTMLDLAGGSPPFQAFPNVIALRLISSLAASDFVALSQQCKGLRSLLVNFSPKAPTSLSPDQPHDVRCAAVQSLKALERLETVQFMVHDNIELVALAGVASVLVDQGLKHLSLFNRNGCLTAGALLHLGRIPGLQTLHLELDERSLDAMSPDDVPMFLAGLCDVSRVLLILPCQQHVLMFEDAAAECAFVGLPAPHSLSIEPI